MMMPICPNCGRQLTDDERGWAMEEGRGREKTCQEVYLCPCGCTAYVSRIGYKDETIRGIPDIRHYWVKAEEGGPYNDRPYNERTYDLHYNGGMLRNVPYDSIPPLSGLDSLRIGQSIPYNKLEVHRVTNVKPRNRLFRRMG